ncbi:SH3 domain-containing protein [Bosea sp. 2RAB26]|uniref:SH3 domain-containing protein n=1 Tax=Bosea sp. 2RAB26 TaxID=3237476 RepID=UPI003F8FCCF9
MRFRFGHSVRLFPGVRLTFSETGISVSAAVSETTSRPLDSSLTLEAEPSEFQRPREIPSKAIARLRSSDLQGLKDLINDAAHQKAALQSDYRAALRSRMAAWSKLRRREQLPLRWFLKSSIPRLCGAFEESESEARKVLSALSASEIKVEMELDQDARSAWAEVEHSHAALARSDYLWDVASSSEDERAKERPTSSSAVTRYQVRLHPILDGIISGSPGVRLENANGDNLDIFGGFVLMRSKGASDYAVIDFCEVFVEATDIPFIENEAVPADAQVIDHVSAISNRDESSDGRFRGNDQLPIVKYGQITITSGKGLHEVFLASNCEAAFRFADALAAFKSALIRQAANPQPGAAPPPPMRFASTSEPEKPLPELHRVCGAYELILIPVALAVAPILVSWRQQPPSSPPIIAALRSNPAEARITGLPSTNVSAAPVRPGAPAQQIGTVLTNPARTRERLVLLQHANVRSGPVRSSSSLRVAPKGMVVTVFRRDGRWIEVGDDQPWGWVNMVLLKKT